MATSTIPPLGPLSALPPSAAGLKEWKILVLVTAVNSFSQRVLAYLKYLGFNSISVCIATSDGAMEDAAIKLQPDLVICPFLTRVIPGSIFNKWVTLVVHPGPPGDAGPSSLDWVLLGDDGTEPDAQLALKKLVGTSQETWAVKQRSHWGTIVFQANEHLDGGAIWAWEQYELPAIGTITKAGLYQNHHSIGAITALITAMIRVYDSVKGLGLDGRIAARPKDEWQQNSVTHGCPFLGGPTRERPLVQSKSRRPDWSVHTAEDVFRIVAASDSQPGAQLAPLTGDSKTALFTYGAHVHVDSTSIPGTLYTSLGYATWDDIPNGRIIAKREGAVLFKTRKSTGPAAIWLTHGRVPKKIGSPLEPKIPLVRAIIASGHGQALQGVQEWAQDTFEERVGEWQEVFVRRMESEGKIAQCVYWNFYNGAFSTEQCQQLLRALRWAGSSERGSVKVLALMGGSYFSNGVALNTIEAATDPGQETWANINAIDDIVEYLLSDTHSERAPFMADEAPLCKKGIVTVACLRGNAAAGGVALAAGCDVVIAGRGVVLNPAYRAMGLHGSEYHSFSYHARCGALTAAAMLRNMMPQSSTESYNTGLVDIEVGQPSSSREEIERLCLDQVKSLLRSPATSSSSCAPWAKPTSFGHSNLVDAMCAAKAELFSLRTTPLFHYRTEELSQMLLDSFHPTRSPRYHTRRYKFIRKVKADSTPARYAGVLASGPDEEDTPAFDAVDGWTRGDEWAWAGVETPASMATSEWTRINLFPVAVSQPPITLASSVTGHKAQMSRMTSSDSLHTAETAVSEGSNHSAGGLTASSTPDWDDAGFKLVTPPSIHLPEFSPLASLTMPGSNSTVKEIQVSVSPRKEVPFEHPTNVRPASPVKSQSGPVAKLRRFGRQLSSALRSPTKARFGADGDKAQDSAPKYSRPVVPGDDKVEFPCLYDSALAQPEPLPSFPSPPPRPGPSNTAALSASAVSAGPHQPRPSTPPLSTHKPAPNTPKPPVNHKVDAVSLSETASHPPRRGSTSSRMSYTKSAEPTEPVALPGSEVNDQPATIEETTTSRGRPTTRPPRPTIVTAHGPVEAGTEGAVEVIPPSSVNPLPEPTRVGAPIQDAQGVKMSTEENPDWPPQGPPPTGPLPSLPTPTGSGSGSSGSSQPNGHQPL